MTLAADTEGGRRLGAVSALNNAGISDDFGAMSCARRLEQHEAVLGRQVRSSAGEDMGRVVNVVVDQSGQVRAATAALSGFRVGFAPRSTDLFTNIGYMKV